MIVAVRPYAHGVFRVTGPVGTNVAKRCRTFRPWLVAVPVLVALLTVGPGAAPLSPRAGQVAPVPATQVDVVVVDRDGKPVEGLVPGSFSVTVDGKPRRVLWVRHVSRGPGASVEAARQQANRSETLAFGAEPARNVLVVIDELSIAPGAERAATQAAATLIDRLGMDDRVGVLRIPVTRDAQLALTTERPEVRAALRQVVGRADQTTARLDDPAAAARQAAAADANRATSDPDRVAVSEPDRPRTEASVPATKSDEAAAQEGGVLPSLQAAITAMRASPGRKIVAVFSAGVPAVGQSRIDDVALAAVASHAVVHAFGLPDARSHPGDALDLAALERLARSTGGTSTMLRKGADKSLERVLSEISACYVLGLEPSAVDLDGKRHALRLDLPREPQTVRAPAWFVARPDFDDLIPRPEASRADVPGAEGGKPAAESAARPPAITENKAPAAGPRDPETQGLLAKAADYIAGYQREYSMLVAEEHYVQNARTATQDLRSDLLLVRPEGVDAWVSFRDVFEVNGKPIRDRDDRLRRLFLDPSAEAQAQLAAIKDESARYNIGQVERNINVPLYALKFLEAVNLSRSRFSLSGTKDVGGVAATRIAFQEVARPTLVTLNRSGDIAAAGSFLIDPASGAVVGSTMQFLFPFDGARLEFVVRYERDADLGLWVPAEMTERYSLRGATADRAWAVDSRATYAKFRRFQVKAETTIKVVK